MRGAILYDLLAPVYGRVLAPLHEIAVARAAERALGGWPTRVLEVGVGPGHAIVQLAGPTRRTVGVDLSPRMLKLSAARLAAEHLEASLVRANVLRLPFPDNRFDAVVNTFLLDLLNEADLPTALCELTRVVAAGGRLVVGLMELPNRLTERAWMAAYRVTPELVGRCRPVALERYLPEHGLRVIREEHVEGWIGMRLVTLVKTAG